LIEFIRNFVFVIRNFVFVITSAIQTVQKYLLKMTIKEIQEEIITEFSMFDDWMERYEYIIDLGKSLPIIDAKYKLDENLIKGCQSKVWLHSELKKEHLIFTADSDAILTKGIAALLLRVFSDQKPAAILAAETSFIDEIGLKEHLSPTRANGLISMIKQIKMFAIALQAKPKY
jgi:cysteine desulfuration protein SufE